MIILSRPPLQRLYQRNLLSPKQPTLHRFLILYQFQFHLVFHLTPYPHTSPQFKQPLSTFFYTITMFFPLSTPTFNSLIQSKRPPFSVSKSCLSFAYTSTTTLPTTKSSFFLFPAMSYGTHAFASLVHARVIQQSTFKTQNAPFIRTFRVLQNFMLSIYLSIYPCIP